VHPFGSSHKKTSLCEALHWRAAMTGVRASWPDMGSSPERKGKGERRRSWGAAWGGKGGAMRGYRSGGSALLLLRLLSAATCCAAGEFCT
jgi:hypothetical protein